MDPARKGPGTRVKPNPRKETPMTGSNAWQAAAKALKVAQGSRMAAQEAMKALQAVEGTKETAKAAAKTLQALKEDEEAIKEARKALQAATGEGLDQ